MVLWLIVAPLTVIFGYLFPAYKTYKAVEMRQPDIDELCFWSKYWILVGALSAFETIFYGVLFFVPLYTVVRLVLLVYLWHPRTQGVLLLYHRGLQPMVSKHEQEIDRGIHELHTRGKDLAVEHARNLVGAVQSAVQQGGGMVRNQYQSFSRRNSGGVPQAANSYPPAPNHYPPYSGVPDSMYNLRARKATDAPKY